MNSQIFYTDKYKRIEQDTIRLLNEQQSFLSPHTLSSTRAAGDAVQEILAQHFELVLGELSAEYSTDFARRAMADLAFSDVDENYYIVDVKTHRTSTKFNMPNLTSVERLSRLYEDDSNYFVLLMVKYDLNESQAVFSDVHFVPIEFLDWSCLTIGALGWGQIQISNSNNIVISEQYSRKRWMLELCDIVLEFYPKEIAKITERITHFEKIKAHWQSKPD